MSDFSDELTTIKERATSLFGAPPISLEESPGDQGVSGAVVRYFEATFGNKRKKFVAKNATLLERRVFKLLESQNQAIPGFSCSLDKTGRDWLIMEYLEAVPYGDNVKKFWAEKLGAALAKIHATNMGVQPNWLTSLSKSDPLSAVYATEWQNQFHDLVENSSKFRDKFGELLPGIEDSWVGFQKDVNEELADQSHLTLINPDFAPDHWLQKEGGVAFIDWETSCFGPLYFDLPNMFDQNTVQYYYGALVEAGVKITREVFVKKFKSLSRYLGFRFMVVGLDFWQNNLSDNLPDDYWQKHGEKFFYQCLDIAQHGYPAPKFD